MEVAGEGQGLSEIETYYDDFSRRFIDDYVFGNERISRQLNFFSRAIPQDTKSVLIIGCGSGQVAHFVASNFAPAATLLALDISQESLKFAHDLFSHDRIQYKQADITKDSINNRWEVILLPDVYEHIPKEKRAELHSTLNEVLTEDGRILITIPSPPYQEHLAEQGALQIVDETVTLRDLIELANDVGGSLTYFSYISVWLTNDYIHAMIERGADVVKRIDISDYLPIKGLPRRTLPVRIRELLLHRLQIEWIVSSYYSWRVKRKLRRAVPN